MLQTLYFRVGELWSMGYIWPAACVVWEALLEHSRACSFVCCLELHSCYDCRAE